MFLKNAHLGNNQWYLYLATFILVVFGTIFGQLPLLGIVSMKAAAEGKSQAEIAEMLNISVKAVEKRMHGALVSLRSEIEHFKK